MITALHPHNTLNVSDDDDELESATRGGPTGIATSRRWWLRLAKILVALIVAAGVSRTVQQALRELTAHAWHVAPAWLLLAAALYLIGLLPAAWYWYRILTAMGQRPDWSACVSAYYIGHLGKYVPGKAMVVVLRTALVVGPRVAVHTAVVAVFLETLPLMSVGALWAAVAAFIHGAGVTQWTVLAGILVVAAGVPTLPPVFRFLARKLRWPLSRRAAVSGTRAAPNVDQLRQITLTTFAQGWLAATISWLLLAWSLWAVLRSLGVEDAQPLVDLPLLVAAVSLSVVAGFLSLLPGGIIVRDAILIEYLAAWLTPASALLAAVLLRLVWLMSELLLSAILYGTSIGRR